MNRPDFMMRQFQYYAKVNSPHPIYIADSSNEQNVEALKNIISKFRNKLSISYSWYPAGPDNHRELLEQTKEKYGCICGDDDYQIPNSLTKCAEFLENNPNYAAASGYAVSVRLKRSGPYGELARLADYPRYSIEAETARQRFIDFMKVIHTLGFFVNRIDNMKKAWDSKLYLNNSMAELIPYNNLIMGGKSKILNCLSLIRQIHDQQNSTTNSFTWITGKNFIDDYDIFKKNIAIAMVAKDGIDFKVAEEAVKEAFWQYMLNVLSYDYKFYLAGIYPAKEKTADTLRVRIGKSFPLLKTVYRTAVRPIFNKNPQIHYEVINPSSPFYKDFRCVMDSFTGKDVKTL